MAKQPLLTTNVQTVVNRRARTATATVFVSEGSRAGTRTVFYAEYKLMKVEVEPTARSLYYKLVRVGDSRPVLGRYGTCTRGFDNALEEMHRQLANQVAGVMAAGRFAPPKKRRETA